MEYYEKESNGKQPYNMGPCEREPYEKESYEGEPYGGDGPLLPNQPFNEEQERRKAIRKDFSRIGWGLLAMLLGAQILGAGIIAGVAAMFPAFAQSQWYTWCLLIVPLYGIGLPMFLFVTRKMPGEKPAQQYKISVKTWLKMLVICYGALYFFNFISVAINAVFSAIKGSNVVNPIENIGGLPIFWTIVFITIVGPIMEEFVFRGLVISKMRKYGEWPCVFVSGFVFGMFHGNLSQLLYAFALGAILAYITVKTGRLRYSIALHIAVNLMGMVVIPNLLEMGNVAALLVVVFIFAAIGLGFFWLMDCRRRIYFAPGRIPVGRNAMDLILGNPGMICYTIVCMLLIVSLILM